MELFVAVIVTIECLLVNEQGFDFNQSFLAQFIISETNFIIRFYKMYCNQVYILVLKLLLRTISISTSISISITITICLDSCWFRLVL